jgi:hypothetical protein
MANNENKAPKTAEDRVEVFVPKGYANDDPNLFVSVNGVNYLLPKGKKSLVPAHVAAEIERSKKAAERQDEKMEQMLEASK